MDLTITYTPITLVFLRPTVILLTVGKDTVYLLYTLPASPQVYCCVQPKGGGNQKMLVGLVSDSILPEFVSFSESWK